MAPGLAQKTGGPHCPLCSLNSLKSTGAVCESCLRKGLRAHHQLLSRYHTSLQNCRTKAVAYEQQGGESLRCLRANIGVRRQRIELARREVERRRYQCMQREWFGLLWAGSADWRRRQVQEQITARRTSLEARKERLQQARSQLSTDQLFAPSTSADDPFVESNTHPIGSGEHIEQLKVEWQDLAASLTEARQSACVQALDMWHIQRVDQDSACSPVFFDPCDQASSGTPQTSEPKGYVLCRIGNCILPPVKDLKRQWV